jgi:hypothetical protein
VAALAAGLDVLDRAVGRLEGPAVHDPDRGGAGGVGAGNCVGRGAVEGGIGDQGMASPLVGRSTEAEIEYLVLK